MLTLCVIVSVFLIVQVDVSLAMQDFTRPMQLTFKKINIKSINQEYIDSANIYLDDKNKIRGEVKLKKDLDERDVEVDYVIEMFNRGKYIKIPRSKINVCEADSYVFSQIFIENANGRICPIEAGTYKIGNLVSALSKLHVPIPSGKYKILIGLYNKADLVISVVWSGSVHY